MAASMGNAKKMKPKNRKTKTFLEFDEKARSEYLRGFQKRKNERRKLAREKQDRRILQERKELLKQMRDTKKTHLRQQAVVIPEIEHLVEPEVFDLPDHTVTIADIGNVDFVGNSGLRLGQNTGTVAEISNKGSKSNSTNDGDEHQGRSKPVKHKSLSQKLAVYSSQLSAQRNKAKKSKKKNMLRQKFRAQKKGQKKGKKK